MPTWKKLYLVSLIVADILLRKMIAKLTAGQERVMTSMMNLVFYRDKPGIVSFGSYEEEQDPRVDGYVYVRSPERSVYRMSFRVQHLPRDKLWEPDYVRALATQAIGRGLDILWIERNGMMTSPTTAQWVEKGEQHQRIVRMFS